jgi:hypothetical protein
MSFLKRIIAKHNHQIKLDSSAIEALRYDKKARHLHVTFRNGGEYIYKDVDSSEVDALMASPSKGRYLVRMIKKDHLVEKV